MQARAWRSTRGSRTLFSLVRTTSLRSFWSPISANAGWTATRTARGSLRFGANSIRVGTTIRSIAVSLAHTLVTNASYRIVNRYLNQLFDASFDKSWNRRPAGRPYPKRRARPIDFRVRKSLRILDDGISHGVELDNVARDAGLSRPHFYKLFRENTGVTPALYANTMRVERALDRLTASQISVTDIGFELGFSSQSHFTHFFAANVGIAPTLYRTIARRGQLNRKIASLPCKHRRHRGAKNRLSNTPRHACSATFRPEPE